MGLSMGQRDAAGVDIGAVLAAAGRSDQVAELLDGAIRTHLPQLSFCGAVAGHSHAARGAAVRDAVDLPGEDMRTWARACVELASCLRASAASYTSAEARGAARLG
jgi:Excreted virulence factor EspC, type VII ESX diderm